jgi:hypothetical protein
MEEMSGTPNLADPTYSLERFRRSVVAMGWDGALP